MSDIKKGIRFSPSLCVTHNCNLNCIYCYQQHDKLNHMNYETGKEVIDWIFDNKPPEMEGIEISFIGGEPLLEFDLIRKLYDYTIKTHHNKDYIFYATTNGTVLNENMKAWFSNHKDSFVLGLSLDGTPETHNYNRSNSFEKIDIGFFLKNWPDQGIKMTLSEHSLKNLANNVIYAHDLGFSVIDGVNLFEGSFDWSKESYIIEIIPELKKLVEYYVIHDDLKICQMLGRQIELCEEINRPKRKWCGIGTGSLFFDTDGKKYPCPFVTPMTFDQNELANITSTDFTDNDVFIDNDCYNNCYIYPICPMCPGANYLVKHSFSHRDKSKCRMQKLITLFAADLQAKRLLKNPQSVSKSKIYNLITAIENIREHLLPEFQAYKDIL